MDLTWNNSCRGPYVTGQKESRRVPVRVQGVCVCVCVCVNTEEPDSDLNTQATYLLRYYR